MISLFSSYETVKYVAIPDKRLAILRWTLLVAILAYVIVVELIQHFGYLQGLGVTGVTRFSLQQPTFGNCDPSTPNCSDAFASLNMLPYCQQYYNQDEEDEKDENGRNPKAHVNDRLQLLEDQRQLNVYDYPGPIYPCQIYEAVNAQVIRETSLVVWTRATTYNQTLVCHESTNQTCSQTYRNNNADNNDGNGSPFYIAQVEAFTIMVEHAVTASSICRSHTKNHPKTGAATLTQHYSCSAQSKGYLGRLLSQNSNLCASEFLKNNSYTTERSRRLARTAPCFVGPNRTSTTQQDFFSVDVLLQAAGVALDDCLVGEDTDEGIVDQHGNWLPKNSSNCSSTLRSSGGTLLLQVVWNDAVSWRGLVEPHYTYIPQLIGDSYKESQSFYYQEYRQARILMRAHGLKVAVLVEGTFHRFQMVQFLLTLTTALGLLAVARVVVDNLMLYVLPDKERYQQAKYETISTGETGASSNAGSDDEGVVVDSHPEDMEPLLSVDQHGDRDL